MRSQAACLLRLKGSSIDIASRLGAPQTAVKKWLSGERKPPDQWAAKIERVYYISTTLWRQKANWDVRTAANEARSKQAATCGAGTNEHAHKGKHDGRPKVLIAVNVYCDQRGALHQVRRKLGIAQSELMREAVEWLLTKRYPAAAAGAPCQVNRTCKGWSK